MHGSEVGGRGEARSEGEKQGEGLGTCEAWERGRSEEGEDRQRTRGGEREGEGPYLYMTQSFSTKQQKP
jgi:hypothetical protein